MLISLDVQSNTLNKENVMKITNTTKIANQKAKPHDVLSWGFLISHLSGGQHTKQSDNLTIV